jgi:hypothetical protein
MRGSEAAVPWISFDGLLDRAFEYGVRTDQALRLRLMRSFNDIASPIQPQTFAQSFSKWVSGLCHRAAAARAISGEARASATMEGALAQAVSAHRNHKQRIEIELALPMMQNSASIEDDRSPPPLRRSASLKGR